MEVCPRYDSALKKIIQALDNLGINENVEKIIDIDKTAKLQITLSPAVIINGRAVFYGRGSTVSEIEEAL